VSNKEKELNGANVTLSGWLVAPATHHPISSCWLSNPSYVQKYCNALYKQTKLAFSWKQE
jgi:hypothetical protein